MNAIARTALGVCIGLGLSWTVIGSTSAQELPTGAARLTAKVEQQIFIATLRLETQLAPIRENAAETLANRMG